MNCYLAQRWAGPLPTTRASLASSLIFLYLASTAAAVDEPCAGGQVRIVPAMHDLAPPSAIIITITGAVASCRTGCITATARRHAGRLWRPPAPHTSCSPARGHTPPHRARRLQHTFANLHKGHSRAGSARRLRIHHQGKACSSCQWHPHGHGRHRCWIMRRHGHQRHSPGKSATSRCVATLLVDVHIAG